MIPIQPRQHEAEPPRHIDTAGDHVALALASAKLTLTGKSLAVRVSKAVVLR